VGLVLAGHEPYPAIAVDRHWTLVAANKAVGAFMTVEDPALLQPPINVMRVSLHPRGVAPRIATLAEWRAHALERLRRQIDASGDPVLIALRRTARHPAPLRTHARLRWCRRADRADHRRRHPLVPQHDHDLRTPVDVTLSELAIEAFYPADECRPLC
jgi:hypothetical protein